MEIICKDIYVLIFEALLSDSFSRPVRFRGSSAKYKKACGMLPLCRLFFFDIRKDLF